MQHSWVEANSLYYSIQLKWLGNYFRGIVIGIVPFFPARKGLSGLYGREKKGTIPLMMSFLILSPAWFSFRGTTFVGFDIWSEMQARPGVDQDAAPPPSSILERGCRQSPRVENCGIRDSDGTQWTALSVAEGGGLGGLKGHLVEGARQAKCWCWL